MPAQPPFSTPTRSPSPLFALASISRKRSVAAALTVKTAEEDPIIMKKTQS
jgi:hypothetical protein